MSIGPLKAAVHGNTWAAQALSMASNRGDMAWPGSLTIWNTMSSTGLPIQMGETRLQNLDWQKLTF